MSTPLHVGTTAWNWDAVTHADTLCAQAVTAERLGFHSFWLPENHFGQRAAVPAPLLLLAAVAARTQHIKLGSTSYLLPIRNPLLAAEEVAVLDRLSGGRLILGLGRGLSAAMFTAFGVAASDKRKLFQLNLEIMRRAWRGDSISEDAQGKAIYLSPLPLQQPSPPLWIAAFGPLALQQVAQLGLPYLASPIETLATLSANYRQYHEGVAEAGLAAVSIIPAMRTVFVSENAGETEAVRTALIPAMQTNARHQSASVEEWAIVGDKYYTRDRLAEYIERIALTHLIVRSGIPGVGEQAQLNSHQRLLEIVAGL
ncbi:MAG: LLM class flavin-dependent oxidoreductase [Halioglobus sp.]